jgi:fructoselysine-6-P-deglycase FrlB-like protein
MAAAVLATDPEVRALDLRLARELAGAGAAVLAVAQSRDAYGSDGVRSVAIGDVDPLIAPAAAIVPLQLLAWRLAVDYGLSPGAYTRASKVTIRE